MGWLRLVGALQLHVSFVENGLFIKETYNFKEPTHRSHPMAYQ